MSFSRKLFYFGIAIIVLGPIVMFGVDYNLVKNQKTPMFAGKTAVYKDGGSVEYKGIGYEIIDYNKIDGRDDIVFISKFLKVGTKDEQK
jgi:lipopolysaccharide export system protein LptC